LANLDPLIRLRRHTVEEKQKIVADLFRQAELIEGRRNLLAQNLQKEREALENQTNAEIIAYFLRFADTVRKDIRRLEDQLSKLDIRIRIAQDDMREAFANLKRVEIVQRNRKAEDRRKIDVRDSRDLDDIGIDVFRRNTEE